MKIIYGKNLNEAELKQVGRIASECGVLLDTARLLLYRGADTVEKAKRFLTPGKHGFIDPFLLSGVSEAVKRIEKARENGENVLVFGDYDADGVCATTVLYYCLKKFGIDPKIVVPEREDGYGVNVDIISGISVNQKIDLIITVDCGISDKEKIQNIINDGTDVIVTDHHEPPEELPNCICINPKIKGQKYPFDGLCGAGVAYKLGRALIGENADEYLDFVALATVADSMDLIDENRDLVVEGLKLIQNEKTQRLAFKYLLGDTNRQITAQTLAYVIAPRVNAGGRMGDAMSALNIFTTEDANQIFDLAAKLNQYNIARQVECDNIYKEAKIKIAKSGADKNKVILVSDQRWQPGFVGIVAAKLVEDYARPVIVFAGHDGYLKGSARSVDGINIYDAISAAKDLLIAYGGHSQAAGVAVSNENFVALSAALNQFVESAEGKAIEEKTVYAEWDVSRPLSLRFAREIDLLEPFGVGNKRPVFTTTVESIESTPLKAGSQHYSYKTDVIDMLDFNGEKNVLPLLLPIKKKIAFEINLSTYKSRESLKGYARQVVCDYANVDGILPFILENELLKINNGEFEYKTVNKDALINSTVVATDLYSINKYPALCQKKKSAFFFEQESVLLSPVNGQVKEDFVYIDKPLGITVGEGMPTIVEGAEYASYLKLLRTDRNSFGLAFNKLLSLNGKPIRNIAKFALTHFDGADVYQAIFALIVFMELKIFNVENGVLRYDANVKSTLTNSKVYSKIYSIIG